MLLYVGPLVLDTPLTDPDEGLHGSIAQEMVERGDLVVPRLLGEPFLDKPILFFWAQAASLGLFGMHAAAVRLPGLLLALLGCVTTGWLAEHLFRGRLPAGVSRVGLLAAACYGTLAVPFGLAQAPVHDVALVPLANTALLAFWRLADSPTAARRASWVMVAGLALGMSILVKGLSATALVGVAIGLAFVLTRRLTPLLALCGASALAIAAAVAAPWYVAMESTQPGYLQYYVVSRHLLGFATDSQRHGGQAWWYYLPIVGAGGLPWILYVWNRVTPAGDRERDPRILLWSWLLGGLLLVSVASSKLVTYVLPVFPALAILAARHWAGALAGVGEGRALRTPTRVHALLFAAAAVALPWVAAGDGAETSLAGHLLFAAAGMAWIWIGWRATDDSVEAAWTRVLIGTGATYALALLLLAPALSDAHSARDLAEHVNRSGRFPPRLFIVSERIGSVVFYLRPDLRAGLDRSRIATVDVDGAVTQAGDADAIAVPAKHAQQLADRMGGWKGTRQVAGRYVVYAPAATPVR